MEHATSKGDSTTVEELPIHKARATDKQRIPAKISTCVSIQRRAQEG